MTERIAVLDVRRLLLLWLLLWAGLAQVALASAGTALPLDVSRAERLDLSAYVQVCVAQKDVTVGQVLQGACQWDEQRPPSVSRGFDRRAFWVRLSLVNSGAERVDRLLSVGHARLQEVSLYAVANGTPILLGRSGTRVPLAAKAVPLPRPTFKLEFDPGEQKTLWLRVASETIVEFAPQLQTLEAGYFKVQRLQLLQALALGCMLLCMFYSMASYLMLRESPLLYFGIFMAAEIVVELTRSGLLQTYLWPERLSFDPRVLSVGVATIIGTFSLFLRSFVPDIRNFRLTHGVFLISTTVFYAGVLWGLFIDYRSGSQLWSWVLIVWILSVMALALQAWLQGSSSARLLLQSFVFLMAIELLRVWSVVGWLDFSEIEAIGNPWALALSSAAILIGMNRRFRQIQSDLARTQAESAARLHFMSQMSHELRSPLATILGQIRLLFQTEMPGRVRQAIDAVRQDARQLLSMIDEILDYAQGTAGRQRLQGVPRLWSRFVWRIEQRARVLAQINGNRLVFRAEGPDDAVFMVDERRMHQVLCNLLTNAANYTRNGLIDLSCSIEPTEAGAGWHLSFAISDTGPGIAPEDQERIFEPFERGVGAHLSHHKGMGMGLAISRQLVELMGGQLALQSDPGKGSRFSFGIVCPAAEPEDMEWADEEHGDAEVAVASADESESRGEAGSPIDTSTLPRPDPVRLKQLLSLADNGQVSDMLDWVESLERESPEYRPFCSAVRDATLQLDFLALRALCADLRSTD